MAVFDKEIQENEINILLKDFASNADIISWTINDVRNKRINGTAILNSSLKICCFNNGYERKLNFRITKDGIRLNCHQCCSSFQNKLVQLNKHLSPELCMYFGYT
jgi:hypothetical protein